MVEILRTEQIPQGIVDRRKRKPPVRTHPWDEWADGQARRLTRGVDYDCDSQSMKRQARRAAKRRGLRLLTSTTKATIVIQFIPATTEESNAVPTTA